MAVKPGKYGQEYEKAIAAGKSASEAHDIAVAGSTAKPNKKKNWAQKLKEKVGVTLKPEKQRRLKLQAKTTADENRLKRSGKKTVKQLESQYKTVKAKKKVTRTSQIKGGLKNAGLTDAEIKRLQGKK